MNLPKQIYKLKPQYSNILDLLNCDLMVKVIKKFLTAENPRQGVIDKCLYLIAMAIQEQSLKSQSLSDCDCENCDLLFRKLIVIVFIVFFTIL